MTNRLELTVQQNPQHEEAIRTLAARDPSSGTGKKLAVKLSEREFCPPSAPESGKVKLIVVGEAPGRREPIDKKPFIGQSGQLLTFSRVEELDELGISIEKMSDLGNLFDFGYAMTVHKAQGSGFDQVIWYVDKPEQPDDEDWRRFAYTAVTRSSRALTILM